MAPVAVDDAYDLGADGKVSVDVTQPSPIPENPLPPPPAFDQGRFVEPTGPWTTPDFVKIIERGQTVVEPNWVEVGDGPGTFGEVTVRDPGSRWTVTNWLEVGERGKGTISVSNGGAVNVRNWTSIATNSAGATGGGGVGLVTVSGPGSTWTSGNWVQVGYGNSWGTVRLLDHAQMTVNGTPATASSGFITVGENGTASGLVEILDGSTLRHNDWLEVGNNDARGEVRVAGGSLLATANWSSIGNNRGLGTVTVSGAGSRWTIGNHLSVGDNGGRGVLRVEGGASVTTSNWVEVGRYANSDGRILVGDGSTFTYRDFMSIGGGVAGSTRGTLYVAEGGRVLRTGSEGFGDGPYILNQAAGRILGGGFIQAAIYNGGFISPGGSIGKLSIEGGLTQPGPGMNSPVFPTGVLQFDIGGTARGTGYDALDVTGAANIAGGKVVLNFVNGFAPHAGDRFTLIDAASATSRPQSVEVRGLAPGFQYTLAVENGDLVLVANSDGTSALPAVQRKGLLANDSDADGDVLTAILVKRPQHGTVTLYRDGSFSYVAHPSFNGTDTFQYRADDGVFESNVATVTITGPQQPANDPPVAVNDTYSREGPGPVTVDAANGVLKNDTDDGRPAPPQLTAVLVRGPERGTLTLNPNGSFTYTPAPNVPNPFGDTFTYVASDGQLQSAPATVRITFTQPNRPPIANPDAKTVRLNQTLTFPASDLTANDTDPDRGNTLTVTAVAANDQTHGTVAQANGIVTYTPERNFKGAASFTYTVSDGHGGTATGTVNVTVTPKKQGTPGTATGHGTLNMRRQSFSFLAVGRSTGKGDDLSILGMLVFEDKGAHVSLRSTDINLLDINSDGKSARLAGTATVNGQSGYTFEATAEDRSASGSNDRFRIKITGPQGSDFRYDSTKGSGNGDRIDRGGNIVITGGKKGGMAGAPSAPSSVLA